jgi:hypothetical protein
VAGQAKDVKEGEEMKYIIQALRTTYHTERKAYPGLNDLINQLESYDEQSVTHCEYGAVLLDINDTIHDINLILSDVMEKALKALGDGL